MIILFLHVAYNILFGNTMKTLLDEGCQKNCIDKMQTRDQLYKFLNYEIEINKKLELSMNLVQAKSVLIVIDYINDICHPDGKIAKAAVRIKENKIIEKVNKVIGKARESKIPIIFVKVGFDKSYVECPSNSPVFSAAPKYEALKLSTWGTNFMSNLDVQDSDYIIVKKRVSAFYSTDLEAVLRAQGADKLIIAGTSTNMAVEATVRDAHDRDYNVVVVSDACEAFSQEIHEASLVNLERIAKLVTHDNIT